MKVEGIYDVKLSVDSGIQKMIATQEQLTAQGVVVVREHADGVEKNVEAIGHLSQDVTYEIRELATNISDKLDETNFVLSWGFANISESLGRMEDTLKSLLESVHDTDRAWAYAQYQKCLENYRKGLHKEAIERIRYAIEGHGHAHIGEKEDYRFHHLLGSLYLGRNIQKPDESVLDAAKAEEEFLAAAYYAEADHKDEAAKAYVNAGISAMLQGEDDRALEHVQKALTYNIHLSEAYFQKAKLLCRLGKEREAFDESLAKAIALHPMYAEKAAVDVDTKKHTKLLEKVISQQISELGVKVREKEKKIQACLDETDSVASKLNSIAISGDVLHARKRIGDDLKQADVEIQSGTLIGLWTGYQRYSELFDQYKSVVEEYLNKVLDPHSVEVLKNTHHVSVDKEIEEVRATRNTFLIASASAMAVILMLIQTFMFLAQYDYGIWTKIFVFGPMLIVGTAIIFKFSDDLMEGFAPTLLVVYIGGIMALGYPEYGWMTILAAPLVYAVLSGIGVIVGIIVGLVLRSIFFPKSSRLFIRKKQTGVDAIDEDQKLLQRFGRVFLE